MYPFLLALLLLLHALAHAGVGIRASAMLDARLVTPLWIGAMVGFLAAAFAIFGLERLRPHAARLTAGAGVCSVVLLQLAGVAAWSAAGLVLGLAAVLLVRRWARCAHPEIHTPTLRTAGAPPVDDAPSRTQRLAAGAAYGMLGLTTALIVARPWYQSWGSTAAERAAAGAGRELAMGAAPYRIDRAVTVQAPARLVWAWLAQMGQDRAGFYSFEGIERAVGLEIRNSDSLVAHWQQRSVGELVRAAPPGYLGGRWGDSLGWRVTRWDPPRTMTLEGWGDFVVTPIDDSASRLRIHTHAAMAPSVRGIGTAWLGLYLFEPAHFVMERAMLTGIKRRAEGVAAGGRPAAGTTSDTHGSTAR